jgi:predicted esterase
MKRSACCAASRSWPATVAVIAVLSASAVVHARGSNGSGGPLGESTGTCGPGEYKIRVPSTYSPSQPMPLLIAFHGDEGNPEAVYTIWTGVQKEQAQDSFILVTPKAPFGKGSWYGGNEATYEAKIEVTHQNGDFINQLIPQLLSLYNVDLDRLWVAGISGGGCFLSYYAILRQDVLAAVVHYMAGCVREYLPPAQSCKIPARVVEGTADFTYEDTRQYVQKLRDNGHEVAYVELPGQGHELDRSTLPATWEWLRTRTLCGTTTPDPDDGGVPPDPTDGATSSGDGSTPSSPADGSTPSSPTDGSHAPLSDGSAPPSGPDETSVPRGSTLGGSCGCVTVAPLTSDGSLLVGLAALLLGWPTVRRRANRAS